MNDLEHLEEEIEEVLSEIEDEYLDEVIEIQEKGCRNFFTIIKDFIKKLFKRKKD